MKEADTQSSLMRQYLLQSVRNWLKSSRPSLLAINMYMNHYYQFQTICVKQIIKMQVQYRNSNYIGDFNSQQYQRSGYGLLILDNSHIVMAKWKADLINGPFAIITDRIRAFGTMNNNKLEGYNVISVQQSLISNKKQKQRTIYGMFRENKLYGKALIIDSDQVIVAHYSDGKLREISQRKPIRDREIYDMLRACFPNQIYAIAQWLNQMFNKAIKQFNSDGSYKYQPIALKFQENTLFYGFSEIYTKVKSVGFLMHQGQVISIGQHEKDHLQGLGRAYYSDGTVEDGVFKQGELNGIGISYSKKNHKYILGEHRQDNNYFEKGFGFPQKQINQIRRQYHLRSIYFYNDIVLISFPTLFQAICSSSLQFSIDNQSPRFSSVSNNYYNEPKRRGISQKSPLRAKINQYEEESQQIEDPSPIKNKPINQYERTDHRTSKYFQNEGKEQRNNYVQNERSLSNSQSRNKQDFPPRQRQRQKQSDSRSKASRKIKDTKTLVRELDQKQRARRGYLDQIYKEAKLYSKKNS